MRCCRGRRQAAPVDSRGRAREAGWPSRFGQADGASPVDVLIAGAEDPVVYALAPMIARGCMLGQGQAVNLRLACDPRSSQMLQGLQCELQDAGFPLLNAVLCTTHIEQACVGVSHVILLPGDGCLCSGDGEENYEYLESRTPDVRSLGLAIERAAAPNCRVLVALPHSSAFALVVLQCAPSLKRENLTFLTRLDHNRLVSLIAARADVVPRRVSNAVVWGGPSGSASQHADGAYAVVTSEDGSTKPAKEVVDLGFWRSDVSNMVRRRHAELLEARGRPAVLSVAAGICDHFHDWVLGTSEGAFVSMGVTTSEARTAYGVPADLCFSFPVACRGGEWRIVDSLPIDACVRSRLSAAVQSLEREKAIVKVLLGTGVVKP